MRKLFLLVLVTIYFTSCKNSKADLSGDEKVSADDFLKAFREISLPILIADTALGGFEDSLNISKTVFEQFVPDSALEKFMTNRQAQIHPAGMIHKKEKDFLLTTFVSGKKIQLVVFVLDDKHKFLTSLPLLNTMQKDDYTHSISITEEPTFIFKKEKFGGNNTSLYSRNGYAYTAGSNSFTEVLHDSNEDTAKNHEIVNPIDTLPSTNKFSGDYISNTKNFISLRDGKNALTYSFFIHFEKNNGACVGELKGSMTLTNEKDAVFTESGDPCVINFKFTGNTIKVKERGNCGNHRGITCPFDFTFKKKVASLKKIK